MSQKSTETVNTSTTKDKPTRSLNGAFTFKGEKVYAIANSFNTWCEKIEKEYCVTLISNRVDYSGYMPIDRVSEV